MVEALLQRGADPNLVLPEGMAAIHLAAGVEQESGIRCLHLILQHGGDPNVRSVEDLTPLHVAASWGCYTCLRLLLKAGGNAWLKDQDGNTALDLALEQGNKMCVRILQSSLEEMDKEQNIWMPERRAESFLTTITEDFSETGGVSQLCNAHPSTSGQIPQSNGAPLHVVPCRSFALTAAPGSPPGDHQEENCSLEDRRSASFLTECSWPCSMLSEQHDLHAQLGASSSPSFTRGNVSGPTRDCSAVWGCPRDGPVHRMGGAAPFHCAEAAAVAARSLSLGLNGALCHAKPCTSRAHPETPGITESHQALSSCVITSECKAEHLPGIRGSNVALDPSWHSSFLDPDLMVELSGQEGLDVTSPDHAYVFSWANSAAVSDLEKTVAEPVLLSRACGSPEGPSASGEPLGRRTDGGGSSPLSLSHSKRRVSAAEDQCCHEARGHRERAACFAQAPGIPASSGNHSLLAQPCHSPHELVETPEAGSFGERPSPARAGGLLPSQNGAALRQAPSRTSAEQLALDLCGNGSNEYTRNCPEPALPRMSPAGSLAKWDKQEQDPQPLPESWEKIQSGAESKLLPGSSDATDERVASQQPQGVLKGAIMPSVAWAEPTREESDLSAGSPEVEGRKSLHTRDTVLTLRAPEETQAFPGSQSPEVPMTAGDVDDTVVVSDQMVGDTMVIPSAKEEASSLEARLRSMMLATRVCHSPLLRQNGRPGHVTPRTKSRVTVSTMHCSSATPSLFDDTLEMPRRPRRRRGPEGSSPASREAQKRPEGTRSGEPPSMAGAGAAEPGITQANSDGGLQLSPPGPPIPSPVVPLNPGGDFAQCGGQSGSACSPAAGTGEQPASGGEGEKRGAAPPGSDPHQSGALCSMARGLPKPSRISFSRISGRRQLSGAPDLISQGVRLSPGGRPVNLSVIEPVQHLYVDEDEGHTLIERHVPCSDNSVAGGSSSEDTIIYNWQVYMGPAAGQEYVGGVPLQASPQPSHLSDEALARKLRDFGVSPGPMTGLTRKVYLQLLEKLMRDPKAKARKGFAGYSPELSYALETYQIPDGCDDEMALARQFDQPDKSKRWREGVLKSSFNYLLLDPRVTQNLPFRCQFVSQAECFRTFISAIFYVGKGKRSRPYSHLYEALTCYKDGRGRRGGQACSKPQHILESWASGEGVISVHCFQNVIPVEAYTREACMLDAMGLKMLTNQKKGDYYGVAANWPMKQRRRLGIYLLHRAMQIFLAEGERQLRPADI
ncbi:ankyrin repeat and LEM domain-containing protein 1 isoform X2 [Varanus komodoensis]|nr:ankyrin repeat and LEM domain-containing protein 1 isoform X2 [Varanus komodoensis]